MGAGWSYRWVRGWGLARIWQEVDIVKPGLLSPIPRREATRTRGFGLGLGRGRGHGRVDGHDQPLIMKRTAGGECECASKWAAQGTLVPLAALEPASPPRARREQPPARDRQPESGRFSLSTSPDLPRKFAFLDLSRLTVSPFG